MHMKNKQKGFIVPLLITIIAVLVIVSGYYIIANKKAANIEETNTATNNYSLETAPTNSAQNPNQDQQITDTQVQVNTTVSTSQNTSLQTYSNTQYSFQLQYPKDWYIGSESSMFDQIGYNFNLSFCPVSLYENGNCKYNQISAQNATLFAPVLLNVISNGSDMPKAGSNTTIIKGPSYTYRIALNNSAYKDTYDQIVASFKVTK